jgi:hypothetical protein
MRLVKLLLNLAVHLCSEDRLHRLNYYKYSIYNNYVINRVNVFNSLIYYGLCLRFKYI